MEDLRLKLRAFIADSFLFGRTDGDLSDDDSLVENGIIDSTGVLMLVAFLEQTFAIQVEDDEIVPENLDSLNRLAAFASRKHAQLGESFATRRDEAFVSVAIPGEEITHKIEAA